MFIIIQHCLAMQQAFVLYLASLSVFLFSSLHCYCLHVFLHITLLGESVSSFCVCSYGQVKWPVLGLLPSMAGRLVLWWGSACRKMLAPTPAWQKTVRGRHPAVLLCLSEVRKTLGHTGNCSIMDTSSNSCRHLLSMFHKEISVQHNLLLIINTAPCKL